jgi:RanBP1 domain
VASLSNPFAHLNAPASPTGNIFGKQEQKTALPVTSTSFSASGAAQASTIPGKPTPFGQQQQPQVSPVKNSFGNLSKPTASTTDFSSQSQQASAVSVLENKEPKLNNDFLFGNLNKPVNESVAQPKVNGSVSETGSTVSSSLFGKSASAANIIGASKSSVSSTFSLADACKSHSNSLIKFTPSPITNGAKPSSNTTSQPQAIGAIFSSMKPLDAPASATQPPPSGMFPSLEHPRSPQKLSASLLTPNAQITSTSEYRERENLQMKKASARQQMREASEMTEEDLAHLIPPNYTGYQKMAFYQGVQMRVLHQSMADFFATVNPDEDTASVLEFYTQQRRLIMGDALGLKRKIGEGTAAADHASKRSKQSVESTSIEPHEQQSNKKVDDEDQENENPTSPTRQIDPPSSARSELNSNGQASESINGNNPQLWRVPSSGVPSSLETPLKRKADDQITKESAARNPLRQIKTPRTNGAVEYNSSGSSTSNIFRNILDSQSKSVGNSSPERKMAAIPPTLKDDAPRTNAFANLPGVSSPVKFMTSPSSSMFGTKSTLAPSSPSSQNLFAVSATSGTPNVFAPKLSTPSNAAAGSVIVDQDSSVVKTPKFGNLAPDFQDQFRQQVKEAEEKELQKAIDEDYDSDDDLEDFKANWRAKRLQKKKELEDIAKNSKGFTFVPPATILSTTKDSSNQVHTATQPSAFTSSLFSQNPPSQTSNSMSSSVNSSRTPTPGFGSSTGSVLDGHIPGKPVRISNNIFGHLSDADSGKGGDADDESAEEASEPEGDSEKNDPTYQPNGEGASGPGTPAEETGPGLASAKKTNPFTSKFVSVSLSGISTPTGPPTGGLFDRITKDGNPSPSGSSTPMGSFTGGLFDRITKDSNGNVIRQNFDVEEKEKEKENTQPSTANPFADMKSVFNKSAIAPSDKTWKPDSPIRFGSAAPSKDGQDPTPTVSVTAATPTKVGSPSSIFSSLNKTPGSTSKPLSTLFGSTSGESKTAAPLSNLFGTPSNPAGSTPATVGFVFGAPSATSSLFPSAAASANTSRATTPGGTTDGDNSGDGNGDGDTEKEKYVPFNLSTGGPGEEHEEVVHEVRAKALKYSPKENGDSNPWESKGVGPLRVLKHKETGVSRILLRMDPTGLIILNKGLLSGVTYEAKEKTVKFLSPSDNGAGLETWILQVKTPAFAKALAEVLEANKPA